MELSQNDLVVVEEALKQAMAYEADYQAILAYQEVLLKLQDQGLQTDGMQAPAAQSSTIRRDGIRYDYDDASDLYE